MEANLQTEPRAAAKPRAKRVSVQKYPAFVHFNITVPMAEALMRICAPSSPINQSTYLRILLHKALMQEDERYRQQIASAGGR